MANKISKRKRNKMFEYWCERQSANYVANKCKVSNKTVARYRKNDNWDERYEKIQSKANEKVDQQLVDREAVVLKNYYSIRDAAQNTLTELIREFSQKHPKSPPQLPIDVEKIPYILDRLESIITRKKGEPDSRVDVTHSDDQHKPDPRVDELLRILEQAAPDEIRKLADQIADEL